MGRGGRSGLHLWFCTSVVHANISESVIAYLCIVLFNECVILDSFLVSVAANWNGFHDNESGVRGYAWCIGSSIGSCDILPYEDPHSLLLSTSLWTNSAVASFAERLPDGEYFVTVQAESGVLYGTPLVTTLHHSTPYRVDTQHPNLTDLRVLGYDAELNQLTLDFVAR